MFDIAQTAEKDLLTLNYCEMFQHFKYSNQNLKLTKVCEKCEFTFI